MGEETAITLSQEFHHVVTISKIIQHFRNLSLDDLSQFKDIGPKIGESIHDWFRDKRNEDFLHRLERNGVELEAPARKNGKLAGKTFVLTGTLETLERNEAKEKIRALDGEVSESVSKKTDYVVVGVEPGSKFEKAKKLDVKIIEEKEFIELLK